MKDLIEALNIFMKWVGDVPYPFQCSHDTLWVNVSPRKIESLDDLRRLRKLGFYIETETEGFYSYRYGSC